MVVPIPLPSVRVSSPRQQPLGPCLSRLALSRRDRTILTFALRKLGGGHGDFGDAVRALREATEELIPHGRVYFLGAAANGPMIGSIVSGVGIVGGAVGISVV